MLPFLFRGITHTKAAAPNPVSPSGLGCPSSWRRDRLLLPLLGCCVWGRPTHRRGKGKFSTRTVCLSSGLFLPPSLRRLLPSFLPSFRCGGGGEGQASFLLLLPHTEIFFLIPFLLPRSDWRAEDEETLFLLSGSCSFSFAAAETSTLFLYAFVLLYFPFPT